MIEWSGSCPKILPRLMGARLFIRDQSERAIVVLSLPSPGDSPAVSGASCLRYVKSAVPGS